jgi:hypothetical protein
MILGEIDFSQFSELMKSHGVKKLFMKPLAENDNSKNQVYFGPDFSSIQIFPNQGILPDKSNFKAKVNFYWLNDEKQISQAPYAQLILYPDYPEVRFSGFLLGARNAPSDLMNKRIADRILFLGVCEDGKIIGYVTTKNSTLAKEVFGPSKFEQVGVFTILPLQLGSDPKSILLDELKRIHYLGWINSKRLTSSGLLECNSSNCGGLTLEAELGVVSNSKSEPDFMGYEVKQYKVSKFEKVYSGSAVTLMTPEPQGGIYKELGAEEFVRRYGYSDGKIDDRMNFSGIHRVGERHPKTGLKLLLDGYDVEKDKITNVNGAVILASDDNVVAAAWLFKDIIAHWSRKHTHAAYIPSNKRNEPILQYAYGYLILLAEKTDPLYLLKALANQTVYYDPGIHLDNISTKPTAKRRSQFRIRPKNISALYETVSLQNLLNI